MLRMRALLAIALTAILLPAGPATARTFFSFGFGFPLGYPYPYPAYPYPYPPPAYANPLAPTPSYSMPYAPRATGLRCHAGAYFCPLEQAGQAGDACACATPRGQAWGRVGN